MATGNRSLFVAPDGWTRWLGVVLVGSLLLPFLLGCVSGAIFFVSGNRRAETVLEEDVVESDQILLQRDFPCGLEASQIFAMVNEALGGALECVEMQRFFDEHAAAPESFRACSLQVVKIPGANRENLISGPAVICGMALGCSAGILEVLDPILLPYAVYTHIKCYGGERYVSIFRDAAGKPILLFNFDVTTGRQAAIPSHITADYWENVRTMWVRSRLPTGEFSYESMFFFEKRKTDAEESRPAD